MEVCGSMTFQMRVVFQHNNYVAFLGITMLHIVIVSCRHTPLGYERGRRQFLELGRYQMPEKCTHRPTQQILQTSREMLSSSGEGLLLTCISRSLPPTAHSIVDHFTYSLIKNQDHTCHFAGVPTTMRVASFSNLQGVFRSISVDDK